MKNRSKIRKMLNLLLQAGIFIITFYFLYEQVFRRTHWPSLLPEIQKAIHSDHNLLIIIMALALMPVNWGLEAAKWKYLIRRIERIRYHQAFLAVLTGISISTFTPNRIGEFFGRVFFLKKGNVIEGILITIVGSMAQLLVTIIAGSAGTMRFIRDWIPGSSPDHRYIYYTILMLMIVLNVLLAGLFFNMSVVGAITLKLFEKKLKQVRQYLKVFAFYHNHELMIVLLLSGMRYLVFSSQYFLLIRFFGIPVLYHEALVLISVIYLIVTIIPTVALTELGIRGSVAVYLFGIVYINTNPGIEMVNAGVLAASVLLWMINLGIPAVTGSFLIFRLQFFRKRSTDGK